VALLIPLLAAPACAHRPWDDPGDRWQRVTSDHFVVVTDAGEDDYRPVVERLEDVHEALSATFFEGVAVPRVQVLMFRRASDYRGVGPPGSAGFFNGDIGRPEGGWLVFSGDAENFDDVASIAAHELAHRFLHARNPRVPAWLHEGFAKYVGAVDLDEELCTFDAQPIHGGYVYFADPVPLARLFVLRNADFHGGRAEYMTAWMLMRQLFGNPGRGWRHRFAALVQGSAVAPTVEAQAQAVSAAFGGLTVAELDQAIAATHSATYHGIGQAPSRRTLAVHLKRQGRSAPLAQPADPNMVKALCRSFRVAAGR
jgi:hypothetical protein